MLGIVSIVEGRQASIVIEAAIVVSAVYFWVATDRLNKLLNRFDHDPDTVSRRFTAIRNDKVEEKCWNYRELLLNLWSASLEDALKRVNV